MQARLGTILCKFGGDPAIFLVEEAMFVAERKCPYHVTFDLDLDLEHMLDAGPSGDHREQIWWRSTIFLVEEAIFVPEQKCPYNVTFDLDLDLEHTLDAGPSGDHPVQVWWRSSHLSGRRSDLRKKFTDGRTDRQTDDGRRMMA